MAAAYGLDAAGAIGGVGAPASDAERAQQLEQFIQQNGLDDNCATALRTLTTTQVDWVLSRGFLVNADPTRGSNSAVVMGRIGQSRKVCRELPNVQQQEVAGQLQNFMQLNNLDESCCDHLRGLSPLQQQAVMEQGLIIQVDPKRGSANSVVMEQGL